MQQISLDRIARQADVGQAQLSIDLISPAYKEWAGGNAPAKQFYKVPIFFRSNSGHGTLSLTPIMKLDGSDDARKVEDEMIAIIVASRSDA